MRDRWQLVVECLAEDERDAAGKFGEDVPFLMFGGAKEVGNTRIVSLEPVGPPGAANEHGWKPKRRRKR